MQKKCFSKSWIVTALVIRHNVNYFALVRLTSENIEANENARDQCERALTLVASNAFSYTNTEMRQTWKMTKQCNANCNFKFSISNAFGINSFWITLFHVLIHFHVIRRFLISHTHSLAHDGKITLETIFINLHRLVSAQATQFILPSQSKWVNKHNSTWKFPR